MPSKRRRRQTTTNIPRKQVKIIDFFLFCNFFFIFLSSTRKFLRQQFHHGWRAIRSGHSRVTSLRRECRSELSRLEANSGERILVFSSFVQVSRISRSIQQFPYLPPKNSEPTKTLKSLVNIRKESVKFVKSDGEEKGYNIEVSWVVDCGDPF
jgi:hypothetical protein